MDFDVVIIGGGPAGTACGIALQTLGVKNCIVDKAVFPRPKLCGGLVTEKTYAVLQGLCPEAVFAPAVRSEIHRVSLYSGSTPLVKADCGTTLRIVERKDFDYALLQHYKALGGTVFEGEALTAIEGHTLITEHHRFTCRHAVAADGALSKLRQLCGLRLNGLAFCLEAAVDAPADALQIRFGAVEDGYGWVFPCGAQSKIGFGTTYDKVTDYKALFAQYCRDLGRDCTEYAGAFVPYGKAMKSLTHKDFILFVGDAAGLVDPLCGEGLYYALLSGKTAAECLAAENPCTEYAQKMAPHRKNIANGVRLRKFFFRPAVQKFFCRKMQGNRRFLRQFVDAQVSWGRYEYGRLWQFLQAYRSGQ